MQLVEQIRWKLEKEGSSVLKMSNVTGISAYKIYKWLGGKGNPKADDTAIIKKWLTGNLEKVPNSNNGNLDNRQPPDPATVILPTGDVKRTLADYIAIIELYNKTLSSAINAGLIDLKNSLKESEANLARGQQEIKEQILVTATAAVQQLSGQVPGVSVPLTGADKGIGGKKKVKDGDGKSKDH